MRLSRSKTFFFPILAFLLACAPSVQSEQAASARSVITINVFKSGLFSGFAHNHVIQAPVGSGTVDEKGLAAEIVVVTRQMRVMDPEVSAKDRAEIQTTMLSSKVLDAERYPEIRFTSSRIEPLGGGGYRVSGNLQLHGVTKALSFEVSGDARHYHGRTKLKQTDFGIKPISIAGGTVKVKDEVEIVFDIYPGELSHADSR